MSAWVYARYDALKDMMNGWRPKERGRGRPRSSSAPRIRLASRERELCECGRGPKVTPLGKDSSLSGCLECNSIDGTGPLQRDIVNALRAASGPVTVSHLILETGATEKTLQVVLNRLMKKGLIGRYMLEEGNHVEGHYYLDKAKSDG